MICPNRPVLVKHLYLEEQPHLEHQLQHSIHLDKIVVHLIVCIKNKSNELNKIFYIYSIDYCFVAGNFGFGSAAQQPPTAFASLAAQSNAPSFGNIAQNQNTGFASPTTPGFGQQQQTSPFKPQGATFG